MQFKLFTNTFIFLILLFHLSVSLGTAKSLQPGFKVEEYQEMLRVNAHTENVFTNIELLEEPKEFKRIKTYKDFGLDNVWELWKNENGVAAISIRGSSDKLESWLLNFYAAMIPGKGSLKISENEQFDYSLSDDPKATVHTGWLMATGWMHKSVLAELDSLYKAGTRDVIITGHSQGGAISLLLTLYLHRLQQQDSIPSDLRIKTYASAAPKVGNLFLAYTYESTCPKDWTFNAVNTSDWVPELPFSIQTFKDFNTLSPFANIEGMFKKVKFPKRMILKMAYNRLNKPTRKAAKNYNKMLGKTMYGIMKKYKADFEDKTARYSTNYARINNTVLLIGDDKYFTKYPENSTNSFQHHAHAAYYFITTQNKNSK